MLRCPLLFLHPSYFHEQWKRITFDKVKAYLVLDVFKEYRENICVPPNDSFWQINEHLILGKDGFMIIIVAPLSLFFTDSHEQSWKTLISLTGFSNGRPALNDVFYVLTRLTLFLRKTRQYFHLFLRKDFFTDGVFLKCKFAPAQCVTNLPAHAQYVRLCHNATLINIHTYCNIGSLLLHTSNIPTTPQQNVSSKKCGSVLPEECSCSCFPKWSD